MEAWNIFCELKQIATVIRQLTSTDGSLQFESPYMSLVERGNVSHGPLCLYIVGLSRRLPECGVFQTIKTRRIVCFDAWPETMQTVSHLPTYPRGCSLPANKNKNTDVIDDPKHLTSSRLPINGSVEQDDASSITENHRINSQENGAAKICRLPTKILHLSRKKTNSYRAEMIPLDPHRAV